MNYTNLPPTEMRIPAPLAYGQTSTELTYTLGCLICRQRVKVDAAEYAEAIAPDLPGCVCDDCKAECENRQALSELENEQGFTF